MDITFDIETGPLPEDQLKAICPPFDPEEVKLGNVKDPEKIKAKLAEAETKHFPAFLNKAALDPQTGMVLVIGFMLDQREPQAIVYDSNPEGEVALLMEFNAMVSQSIGNGDCLIGFSIKNFDIPFLVRRMWINGIKPNPLLFSRYRGRISYNEEVTDIYEEWMMGQRSFDNAVLSQGLDQVAKSVLGVGKSGSLGKHFSDHFLEDRKTALEYCKVDVKRTNELWQVLKPLPQPLQRTRTTPYTSL